MATLQHDVILVGAGHNTLTTAAYLALCGVSVLVLEKNAGAGGGAISREAS
jgi:phytoene dehydrogenase-like protein